MSKDDITMLLRAKGMDGAYWHIIYMRAHKIFHLVQDSISSVPEKVFLVDDSLDNLKAGLDPQIDIIGIIGPSAAIKRTLTILNNDGGDAIEDVEDTDLSINEKEKAAIHIVELKKRKGLSRSTCVVAISAPDSFYYTKPYNPSSILYLLVRYMGDLCSTIIIAYDEKIEQGFEASGCPYSNTTTSITKMKMSARSVKDITINEFAFDLSKIIEFSKHYYQNVDFSSPDHNNSLTHLNKDLRNPSQERERKEQNRIIVTCWTSVFCHLEKNPEQILKMIGRIATKEDINQVLNLCARQSKLVADIGRLLEKTQREIKESIKRKGIWKALKDFVSGQQSIVNRVYYLFVQQCELLPDKKFFKLKTLNSIPEQLTNLYVAEMEIDSRHPDDIKLLVPHVDNIFNQVISFVQDVTEDFYSVMERMLQRKDCKSEFIEAVTLNMQVISDRLGKVTHAAGLRGSSFIFKQNVCIEQLEIEKLEHITAVRVYDLNEKKQSKLMWVELTEQSACSAILLSYRGDRMKVIKKYFIKNMRFSFCSENQKGYILQTNSPTINHFKINDREQIVEECTVHYSRTNREIISFGVTVYPERVFYLTKERNILYRFTIGERDSELRICQTTGPKESPIEYLRLEKQRPYDFVKCFNEDIYVIVGNNYELDLIEPDSSGKLCVVRTFELGESFIGVNIFSDSANEYMLIHDHKQPKLFSFANMSARNILKQENHLVEAKKGNPILDVFFEAFERFGEYRNGQLTLLHVTKLSEDKICSYTDEMNLNSHKHKILTQEEIPEAIRRCTTVRTQLFLQLVNTRIPIQICSIQQGNFEPLCAGKRENTIADRALSIAQRSHLLNFGAVEDLMLKDVNRFKKMIVVSVMGAQSSGKSYLMNRLFGTRFTVAASRTTDGIWISFMEADHFNYLLMDCEGLFTPDRSPKEEEKLIRVLASVSDYTIMNQNMGLSNRSLKELMENIAVSAYGSQKEAHNLYKGEIFVVVRDVKSSESEVIKEQFKQNFVNNEKKRGNEFIIKLFNGDINLFTVNNFENKEFRRDINEIRKHFDSEGAKRTLLTSQGVLEKLKIVLTRLLCDDTEKFSTNLEEFRLQLARDEAIKVWQLGSIKNNKVEGIIGGKEVSLMEKEVRVGFGDKDGLVDDLAVFSKLFEKQFLEEKLATTKFNSLYREFNDFVVKFFSERRRSVEETIAQETQRQLKNIDEGRVNTELSKLRNTINQKNLTLKLCLNSCSTCRLFCIERAGHRSNIDEARETVRVGIYRAEESLKAITSDIGNMKRLTKEELEISEADCERHRLQLEDIHRSFEQLTTDSERYRIESSNLARATQQASSLRKKQCFICKDKLRTELDRIQKSVKEIVPVSFETTLLGETSQNPKSKAQFAETQTKLTTCVKEAFELLKRTLKEKSDDHDDSMQAQLSSIKKLEEIISEKQRNFQECTATSKETRSRFERVGEDHLQFQKEEDNLLGLIKEKGLEVEALNKSRREHQEQQMQLAKEVSLPFLEDAERELMGLEKVLHEQRYHKNVKELLERRLIELEQTENKLGQFQPAESKALQSKFSEYEASLKLKLMETQKKGSLEQPKKEIDCKSDLESKIRVWNKKLLDDPTNDKYRENVLRYEQLLAEFESQKALISSQPQQTEQQLRLKRVREAQINSIEENYGKVYSRALEALSRYANKDIVGYEKVGQDSAVDRFLKANPKFSNKRPTLVGVLPEHLQMIMNELERNKTQYDRVRAEYDLTEDDSELNSINEQLKVLKNEMTALGLKVQFARFQLEEGSSTECNQSLVDLNMRQILQEKPELKEGASLEDIEKVEQRQATVSVELKAVQDEYDETEDDDRLTELKGQLQALKGQQKQLKRCAQFTEIVIGKTLETAKEQLKQFLSFNVNYQKISEEEVDIFVDIKTKTVRIRLKNSSSVEESLNQDFAKFLGRAHQSTHKQEMNQSFEPLFKALVQNNPANLTGKVIALKTLLSDLKSQNSTIATEMVICTEQAIISGNIETLRKDLLEHLAGDVAKTSEMKYKELRDEMEVKRANILQMKEKKQRLQNLKQNANDIVARQEQARRALVKVQYTKEQNDNNLKRAVEEQRILKDRLADYEKRIQSFQQQIRTFSEVKKSHEDTVNDFRLKNQGLLKKLQIVNSEELLVGSLMSQWSTEQLNNLEYENELIATLSTIELLEKELPILLQRNEGLKGILQGYTFEDFTKDLVIFKEKAQQMANYREKLSRIEQIEHNLADLQRRKESLDTKEGLLCSCKTNHLCDIDCEAGCKGKLCHKPAGHAGSHLCAENTHTCPVKCQVQAKCQNKCAQQFGHSEEIKHDCQDGHQCPKKCKYCNEKCANLEYEQHDKHNCNKGSHCMYTCILCDQPCASKLHDHDDHLEEVVMVENRKKEKDEVTDTIPQRLPRKMHLCANEHSCIEPCSEKGVCIFYYQRNTKIWKKHDSEIPYQYMTQISEKKKCLIPIPAGRLQHVGQCTCKRTHSCLTRCPDCKSLCELEYGHQEAKHRTQHRNQESLIYIAEKQDALIRVQTTEDSKDDLLFFPGDESTPTNCNEGCNRKGRGHYHLKECLGGTQCGQKKYRSENVRHSRKRYYPHTNKKYDMYLCAQYWESFEFEMPNLHKMDYYSGCNFACTLTHDNDPKKHLFCRGSAWHSFERNRDSHQFDCDKEHKEKKVDSLEICFLVDATLSMGKWIEQCKKTIQRIIKRTTENYPNMKVRFGAVGYRDHPAMKSKMLRDLRMLAQKKRIELSKMPGQSPLNSKKMTWNGYIDLLLNLESLYSRHKKNFDAHQKKLSDVEMFVLQYHYPFVLEANYNCRLVSHYHTKDPVQSTTTSNLVKPKPPKQQSILNWLISDLGKEISCMLQLLDVESEVLSKIDFTTAKGAVDFLNSQNMRLLHGIDFSEAVLDGMNEVTNLSWTKSGDTLKYVFHLFDSPPHGLQYSDNSDYFPEGCPCGLREQDIIKKLNELHIKYVVFPLDKSVNKALEIFKAAGLSLQVQKVETPEDITVHTMNILVEQLEQKDLSVCIRHND